MALYLGRAEHDGSENGLKRIVVECEGGELVVSPGEGDTVVLEVRVGHEHERHVLPFGDAKVTRVNAQSKLIKIEETGASLPEAQRAVRQQSKLIKIEETGRAGLAVPRATILL